MVATTAAHPQMPAQSQQMMQPMPQTFPMQMPAQPQQMMQPMPQTLPMQMPPAATALAVMVEAEPVQTSNPLGADAGSGATQASNPAEFLSRINLGQYESKLAELGATEVDHFIDLQAEDLQETGMKQLEVKRFLRSVQQYAQGAVTEL
jgi:hypothetical protein|eukprot:COSAG02_NODE_20745_length_817_cov_0.906685_2_plen_149_part_00